MIILWAVRMTTRKNKQGFQQFGRIIPNLSLPDFKVGFTWRGADLQTLRNSLRPPRRPKAADYERVSFDLGAGRCLKAALHRSEKADILPLIIVIHGMAGDELSANVVSAAAYFGACGFPVLRLNLRGAGPSAKTSIGPYHGGLTEDLAAVVEQLASRAYGKGIVLYGISLGANMMLKYLGEQGVDAPIKAAVAVSAPLSLKSVQLCLMSPRNKLYHNYLLLGMKNYVRQMTGKHDQTLRDKALAAKSLYEFDDDFTAPAHGMSGAEEYYRLQSAEGFVDRIARPTLIIHAKNDPWIDVEAYYKRPWLESGHISFLITDDGGHVGFHTKNHKVPWQERVAVQYIERELQIDGELVS